MDKKTKKEAPLKIKTISVRLTDAEHKKVLENVFACGISLSKYARKRLCGYDPPARMTEEELNAINLLEDVRGDLLKVINALHARNQEERKRLFKDDKFMIIWIKKVNEVINKLTTRLKWLRR